MITFEFNIARRTGGPLVVSAQAGRPLFVVGANGTGKSTLMLNCHVPHRERSRRITAHRQTWLQTNASQFNPRSAQSFRAHFSSVDIQPDSRWKDENGNERTDLALYNLIESENNRARLVATVLSSGQTKEAIALSKIESPIQMLNSILRLSNIPIELLLHDGEFLARRNGGEPYSAAKLSDGERAAMLLAASVVTAPTETLILVDEPERHLHPAISASLLKVLFGNRSDCAFVISTHDVSLPLAHQASQVLLVRDCFYDGEHVAAWDVDLLAPEASINDELKQDILGARRKVLFVEGDELSLDKPLYALLFPGVSIIPKRSCDQVERAVAGIRGAAELHWVEAFGIVDGDGRELDEVERLKKKGIYALPVISVEGIYYDPEIQRRVAIRQSAVDGSDPAAKVEAARTAALASLQGQEDRLARHAAHTKVKETYSRQSPGMSEIEADAPYEVKIDVPSIVAVEKARLLRAMAAGRFDEVLQHYSVRSTPALGRIAVSLGFRNAEQYQASVRRLLVDDADSVASVRKLFGDLAIEIVGGPSAQSTSTATVAAQ